jgi:hypothetical protein
MHENIRNACVVLGTLRPHGNDARVSEAKHPSCARCGKHMSLLNSFLDPRSGNQVRTLKYECGAPVMVVHPE